MNEGVVSLPMYDWPELQTYNNNFYKELRRSFLSRGFKVSAELERKRDRMDVWLDENLLLSQSCGLPFRTVLKDKVALVGTPAYGLNCGAGSYYSVIVVHQDSSLQDLEDLKNKTFAYNEKGSQSGYAALLYTLSAIKDAPKHFTSSVQSGGHRQSIQAVAEGHADFAAIDALSWELALRHEPSAQKLRVIAHSEPTPTLPYITALRPQRELDKIHMAVVDAMVALDEETREALLFIGFAPMRVSDYRVIEERLATVQKVFGPNY